MKRAVPFILAALAASSSVRAADQALIDAAKKEGRVVWYTTLVIDQFVRPAAEVFEKKYGVKVDYVRTTSNEVQLRVLNEGRAGRVQADVADSVGQSSALRAENMLARWTPDLAKTMAPQFVDKEGRWTGVTLFVLTPGFNTQLVPKGTEPRTFEDLLDPKWKGKIAVASIPVPASAPGFVGVVLAHMGEEKGMDYLRKLARQNVVDVGIAAGRPIVDLLIAGEHAVALQIFHHHAATSAAQGAPVHWIAMQPAFANLQTSSLLEKAPHPNAGKLLIDFLVSREAQAIFRDANYIPVDPEVPLRDPSLRPNEKDLKVIWFSPEEIERSMGRWTQIYKDLFR
jgi:ABC-type Fe3+ transport system substrate-binding protein